jgi:transposase
MEPIAALLARWQLTTATVLERVYRAITPRERERWHALWLLAQGWSEAKVATALDRDPHTIGLWVTAFRTAGPVGLSFEQTGGSPPP